MHIPGGESIGGGGGATPAGEPHLLLFIMLPLPGGWGGASQLDETMTRDKKWALQKEIKTLMTNNFIN